MNSSAHRLRSGFFGIGASVSIGALVALGCGSEKSEAPPAEAPAETPAAAPAGQPAVPGAVGQAWSASLPEDFPQDVPRYPDAAVAKAQSTADGGLKVIFTTPDEASKVAAFFSDSLAAQGWSTQRVDAPDGTLVFGDKGARSTTVGIGTRDGVTQIDLLVVEMR